MHMVSTMKIPMRISTSIDKLKDETVLSTDLWPIQDVWESYNAEVK